MNHATDSLLQAYHDGEIDGSALAELRDHLAGCAQCTRELDELRRAGGQLHDALSLLDVPAPMLRARAAIAGARQAAAPAAVAATGRPAGRRWWLGASSLTKAALLLLALASASAAIPGSPMRRALESLLAPLFMRAEPTELVAPPIEEPAATPGELRILPASGRVRVVVHGATAVDVTVRLVDAEKAIVETSSIGQAVSLTSARGRAEVSGLTRGTLSVAIPRTVRRATVEIDGRVYVEMRDGLLQLTGPAGVTRGDEVSFRIGQ